MPINSIVFLCTCIHLGLKARQTFSLGQWLTRYADTPLYHLLLNVQTVQFVNVDKISKGETKMKSSVDLRS
jgi:hypothetical protein